MSKWEDQSEGPSLKASEKFFFLILMERMKEKVRDHED